MIEVLRASPYPVCRAELGVERRISGLGSNWIEDGFDGACGGKGLGVSFWDTYDTPFRLRLLALDWDVRMEMGMRLRMRMMNA